MKIDQLNVSFIWTRTYFHLFDDTATVSAPFGFFARYSDYRNKFNELLADDSQLTYPWEEKTSKTNWFWKYYLGTDPFRTEQSKLSNLCWKNLVPFRKTLKRDVMLPWSDPLNKIKDVSLEGFFYRHGVALVCTLRLRKCENLDDAVNRALEARYQSVFALREASGSMQLCALTALSEDCLNELCRDAIHSTEGYSDQPFSIAAVASGYCENEEITVEQGSQIHSALEGLTSWNSSWKTIGLTNLSANVIPIKKYQPEDVLYGHENGRALWIPRLFVPVAERRKHYALRWYYRNLVIASMHARSLAAFLVYTNRLSVINPRLKDHARIARSILLKLQNVVDKSTYQTNSLKVQISNDIVFQTALNQLNPRI